MFHHADIPLPRFEELQNYLSECKRVRSSNTGISKSVTYEIPTKQESVDIPSEIPFVCKAGPSRAPDPTGYEEPKFAVTTDDKSDQKQPKNQQKFMCDLCSKSFNRKTYRNKHIKTHSEERPFICKICCDAFRSNRNLKEHMLRKHSNEKSYLCDQCGKRFAIKQDFINHMRIHLNGKPRSCEFCHKKFVRNDDLRRHERSHTGEKPYSCKLCGKRFSYNAGLLKHKYTHTEEKTHRCEFCKKCFKYRKNLKLHVIGKHSGMSIPIGNSAIEYIETPGESHVIQDLGVLAGVAGNS
ncbi:hypothetical protein QAD02_009541 [Eretmocerus hayati]|uniref:Uncharacterized protein n=1 Tax=Eretmocerus hayati TaxID=131215 RepID=A0ACC2NAW4_9HYME|nr:hypothetical protein QAD02_009541 [Eretmocerus hayati]